MLNDTIPTMSLLSSSPLYQSEFDPNRMLNITPNSLARFPSFDESSGTVQIDNGESSFGDKLIVNIIAMAILIAIFCIVKWFVSR